MIEKIETGIEDLVLFKPKVYEDPRGYFYESYNQSTFLENFGTDPVFVQDNQSMSNKGVLRGLHFQIPPFEQGKLVRVISGSVYDVAVDLRPKSSTYGKHFGVELSGVNHLIMWIPSGFAHGFQTLEDKTVFAYKCSGFYNKASEGCIKWNDLDLNISWPVENPILSAKDIDECVEFKAFNSPFGT